MQTLPTQTSPLADTSARITAEVILGKIRFDPRGGEPSYLPRLRELFKRIEKAAGREKMEACLPEIREAMHALADGLFDEVTGVKTEETTKRIKGLPTQLRLMVESAIIQSTGKIDNRRWNDALFHMRKTIDQMVSLSVTGITPEEIRIGYDGYVHAVVDRLCDNWRLFID